MCYRERSKTCNWERYFLFFFLVSQDCGCSDKHASQRKVLLKYLGPFLWSIMWAEKMTFQFVWNQWNGWVCSWWLLKRGSCVVVYLEFIYCWNACVHGCPMERYRKGSGKGLIRVSDGSFTFCLDMTMLNHCFTRLNLDGLKPSRNPGSGVRPITRWLSFPEWSLFWIKLGGLENLWWK